MGRKRTTSSSASSRKMRPALTPEAHENQMISLAMDLAEKKLRDGTASSQLITHFLKLGTTKAEIEKETLKMQNRLAEAKIESLQSNKRLEDLYENALNAMKRYSGQDDEDEEYNEY